jgi:hypothetical protein
VIVDAVNVIAHSVNVVILIHSISRSGYAANDKHTIQYSAL